MAIIQVNSTSYVDLAGLELGLRRLSGEDSASFLDRLYKAAAGTRDHSYQGLVNEICFRLGLQLRPGMRVTATNPNSLIWVDARGLHLAANDDAGQLLEQFDIPLRYVQGDGLLCWYMLDEIAAAATNAYFTTELLMENAPAVQLARQSNLFTIIGETIRGARGWLEHGGVIADSVLFNLPAPAYTLSPEGELAFGAEIPSGLTICYQYRTLPYELVCSEVGLMGLQDAGLAGTLVDGGRLIYQIRESVQEIMQRDRSYWAR